MKTVPHVICTFCGCTCDDIELHIEDDRVVKARNACALGDSWFKYHPAESAYPAALIDGQPTTLDAAVEATADILAHSSYPLIYGLSNTTCEAQRAAVTLAESLGGVVDNHSSL
jgi:formylmethanofuran dehydrogenase subunit B